MADLTTYKRDNFVKMLLIGESGSGKTGALASLARAGYKLRILDFDNGLDILPEVLAGDPPALARIEYETCTDRMCVMGGKVQPKGPPQAYSKAMNLLTKWKGKEGSGVKDLGTPATWGRDTILVIDSFTHLGNAALRHAQALNSNSGGKVTQPEWGAAQNACEAALALLYSADFKTNVIVLAHVSYIGGEEGKDGAADNPRPIAGYPTGPGKALSPRIPSYFNTMLLAKTSGTGIAAKRNIYTIPDGLVSVKQPLISAKLPNKLPLDTGLATFFEASLGKLEAGK